MSRATSLVSVAQQLSIAAGVAVGALAVELMVHAKPEPIITAVIIITLKVKLLSDFFGLTAGIAGLVDGQWAVAVPGNAHAVVEAFDLEGFAGQLDYAEQLYVVAAVWALVTSLSTAL